MTTDLPSDILIKVPYLNKFLLVVWHIPILFCCRAQGSESPIIRIDILSEEAKPLSCAKTAEKIALTALYKEFRPSAYRYRQDVDRDKENAFTVGGENSDEVIKKMTGISGVDLETLEKRARPVGGTSTFLSPVEKHWEGSTQTYLRKSGDGFIEKEQSLRDLLLTDNQTVRKLGLTHQKIAEPLLAAMKEYESMGVGKAGREEKNASFNFEFQGRKYHFESTQGGGVYVIGGAEQLHKSGWEYSPLQGSFFNDHLFANYGFTITEVSTGAKLKGDALTPHLIHRYGFYQGGSYRMDPHKIADFFHLGKGSGNGQ